MLTLKPEIVEKSGARRRLETALFFRARFLSQVTEYKAPRMLEKLFYGPKPGKYQCAPRLTDYSYGFGKESYGDSYRMFFFNCETDKTRKSEIEVYRIKEYTIPSLVESVDLYIKNYEETVANENDLPFIDDHYGIERIIQQDFEREFTNEQYLNKRTAMVDYLRRLTSELSEQIA